MHSWIKRDCYAVPDPLLLNSGTKTLEKDNVGGVLDADSNNHGAWHVADVVENRFNRLSIFQGLQSHMSADYFGSGLADGRLFKIFFFNAEDALA